MMPERQPEHPKWSRNRSNIAPGGRWEAMGGLGVLGPVSFSCSLGCFGAGFLALLEKQFNLKPFSSSLDDLGGLFLR